MQCKWWFTGIRAKINSFSAAERRIVNNVIKAPETTENTLLSKVGITVGEYCAVLLSK
jgi:hypothetical protein